MIESNLSVSVKSGYEMQQIDSNYFANMSPEF